MKFLVFIPKKLKNHTKLCILFEFSGKIGIPSSPVVHEAKQNLKILQETLSAMGKEMIKVLK